MAEQWSPIEQSARERTRYRVMAVMAVVASAFLVAGLGLLLAGSTVLGAVLALVGAVDLLVLPMLGRRLGGGPGPGPGPLDGSR